MRQKTPDEATPAKIDAKRSHMSTILNKIKGRMQANIGDINMLLQDKQ